MNIFYAIIGLVFYIVGCVGLNPTRKNILYIIACAIGGVFIGQMVFIN